MSALSRSQLVPAIRHSITFPALAFVPTSHQAVPTIKFSIKTYVNAGVPRFLSVQGGSNLTLQLASVSAPSQSQLAPHTRYLMIFPACVNARTSHQAVPTLKFLMNRDVNAGVPMFKNVQGGSDLTSKVVRVSVPSQSRLVPVIRHSTTFPALVFVRTNHQAVPTTKFSIKTYVNAGVPRFLNVQGGSNSTQQLASVSAPSRSQLATPTRYLMIFPACVNVLTSHQAVPTLKFLTKRDVNVNVPKF